MVLSQTVLSKGFRSLANAIDLSDLDGASLVVSFGVWKEGVLSLCQSLYHVELDQGLTTSNKKNSMVF